MASDVPAMVDRVARARREELAALATFYARPGPESDGTVEVRDGRLGCRVYGPATLRECEHWIERQCARAAIRAMREPSEAMIDAFFQAREGYDKLKVDRVFPRPTLPDYVWRAMIDAALGEGEG